jgi:hypothetical protein
MAQIKILAGDFNKMRPGGFMFGIMSLTPDAKILQEQNKGFWKQFKAGAKGVSYNLPDDVEEMELASEESVKKIGGTVGWGAAGALLLGPAGLLAGLLLGGKKKNVTFVCKFKDGLKLLGETDSKTWAKIQAKMF